MSDFAPNYTARYRLKYTAGGQQHTMLFRGATKAIVTAAPWVAGFSAFLNSLAPALFSDWTILGADAAEVNSDVWMPAPLLPAITAGLTGGAQPRSNIPRYISFAGRSGLGNATRAYVFGTKLQPEGTESADYRFQSAENANIAAALASLAAWPSLLGPDLAAVAWYPYANYGINAYYQRKLRRG